ncbi:MAG: cache domain-containing protein [Dongiaceae bacterium]
MPAISPWLLAPLCRARPILLALALLAGWVAAPPARAAASSDRLSAYAYEDTRQLVAMVEDAADLVAREGTAAFGRFTVAGSRWLHDDVYVFVYAVDGTCVFHPASPELVGRNLIDLRDIHGKPVVRWITDVARRSEPDAAGWVFYLWEERSQVDPRWKSAYVRKVVAPDGKVYAVGAGSYNIKIEMKFVQDSIDEARDLILSAGKAAAFQAFLDPASPFAFLATYVFVLDPAGRLLVDPAYPNMAGRDLSGFRDAVGAPAIQELLAKLQQADRAAVLYLWPKPGSAVPDRKVIVARKLTVGGETMIVGTEFFLATPIWMKVEAEPRWPSAPPA